ncbi:MAG: MotA/TolQ/ExbB proton channel family protein [Planctomycetota bacterium]|nr:MAG: MotA/TolQ/ExbB proton channel family protein [Planctomycetota bacterium]
MFVDRITRTLTLRGFLRVVVVVLLWSGMATIADAAGARIIDKGQLDVRELLRAGGFIGYLTIALSIAMVAMIVEHLLTIRRGVLVPPRFTEECRQLIAAGQITQAETLCREKSSLLSYVVGIGLQESELGTASMIKAMEDAIAEQAARLSRKIETLALIGVIGPMLGLMGTVWGMIQAFGEFAEKVTPRTADFAPSISEALVTTLFGLCVAIPAQVAYSMFRNRIDSYIAEAALSAEQIIGPLKRRAMAKRATTLPGNPSPSPPTADGGRRA